MVEMDDGNSCAFRVAVVMDNNGSEHGHLIMASVFAGVPWWQQGDISKDGLTVVAATGNSRDWHLTAAMKDGNGRSGGQ
jgi:hypothetical protein